MRGSSIGRRDSCGSLFRRLVRDLSSRTHKSSPATRRRRDHQPHPAATHAGGLNYLCIADPVFASSVCFKSLDSPSTTTYRDPCRFRSSRDGKTPSRHRLRRCRRLFADDGRRRGRNPCRVQGPSKRDVSDHSQSWWPAREEHRRRFHAGVSEHRRRHRGGDRDAGADGRTEQPASLRPRHAISSRHPHGRRDGRRGRSVRGRCQHRRPSRNRRRPRRRRDFGQGLPARPASTSAPPLSMPARHRFKNIAQPVHVWTWTPGGSGPATSPRLARSHIRTCRRNIERRSSACFRSPISATAPTNIFPTD